MLLGFALLNHVLGYLSSGSLEKNSIGHLKYSSADHRGKEKLFSRICFFYIFSKTEIHQKNNQNSLEILQEYLDILAAGKLGDEKQELPEHKLVNTKNRSGLWKVTAEVFEIFCIAKQIFKKRTETCSNKIDKAVIEGTSVLANFSK